METSWIKKIKEKIETKKEFIFLLVIMVAFSFVFYLTFFRLSLNEEETSEHSESLKGDYSEYSSRINSANVNIEDLIDSEQVKRMKYYERLIEEKNYDKGKNPFVKTR